GDRGGGAGRYGALLRERHRHRDPRGPARQRLRGVPPGRRDHRPRVRGHGPRALHHQEVRRAACAPAPRGERVGQGLDILLRGAAPGRRQERHVNGKTVLYVEDNEFNRKIVRQLLSRTSYRLIEASDGEAGVAAAREQQPDLILMDVQLPKMSGLDATRVLKRDTTTAHIPIIVITSFALSGDDQRATDAGASSYLAKPDSPRDLLGLIGNFAADQ